MSLSESDIAVAVVRHLSGEGWDCYAEVALGDFTDFRVSGICDIVAVKDHLAMAVEVKQSLGFGLLEQAMEWTSVFPLTMVVTKPRSKSFNRFVSLVHTQSGIGVATANGSCRPLMRTVYRPRLLRHNLRNVSRIRDGLSPMMKLSVPGASATFRYSPFEETMSEVRIVLAQKGPMTISSLVDELDGSCRHHYSSRASFVSSLGQAIRPRTFGGEIQEPDIIEQDRRVLWKPDLCRHGADYAETLLATAERRRQMARAR